VIRARSASGREAASINVSRSSTFAATKLRGVVLAVGDGFTAVPLVVANGGVARLAEGRVGEERASSTTSSPSISSRASFGLT